MMEKIIIIGGVAGGASAAARLRRLNENLEIILFEKGEYISFANCGLPYYIGEEIKDRDKLLIQTVDGMSERFNMDIRNFNEVISIDSTNKKVKVKNLKTNELYEESFDKLILSPGAAPINPSIPGKDSANNVFTLRNLHDTDKIKEFVDKKAPKNAVIIGGGFIGIEMAENLANRNINVTLVDKSNQVMAPVDFEMANIIHEHLIDNAINLVLNNGISSIENKGNFVLLEDGKKINTDLIILAIGVKPESKIAKEAGLKINERGAIVVNEYLETSAKDIFAIGDAIEVSDFINGFKTQIPLAWPANRQGRILADNIAGKKTAYKGTLGSSVAKVFNLTVASTGNSEKTLKRFNLDYKVLHIHPNSHAGYYPGAFPIHLKLLFNNEGKILGAQAIGYEGVEKRIDVIATAIKGELTVFDLPDLELCYAPPYSSAKDPVNMAGYVASNMLEDNIETVQWHEIDNLIKENAYILDVRNPIELQSGKIKSAINIPLDTLRENLDKLPKDKKIFVYCKVGLRGYLACRILNQNGFKSVNIDGGFTTYSFGTKDIKSSTELEELQEVATSELEKKECATMNKKITLSIDACGLQCPGPIRRVFEEMDKLNNGDILEVKATDPGFKKDITSWCKTTKNELISSEFSKTEKAFIVQIRKGLSTELIINNVVGNSKDDATLVVFSGDLDKAIASFIIATGAASMGKKVTMFFTFWGLNILKKEDKPSVKKDTMEKMFDMMLPNNSSKLPLSKMNMAGMGPKMIKKIMEKNNVDSLETLMENALKMGVNILACSMSMDLMGIKREELIDGIEVGGVATYLTATDDAGLNLFI
ncbi:MAG: CoA-disulfide reductase [Sarcina sp.]